MLLTDKLYGYLEAHKTTTLRSSNDPNRVVIKREDLIHGLKQVGLDFTNKSFNYSLRSFRHYYKKRTGQRDIMPKLSPRSKRNFLLLPAAYLYLEWLDSLSNVDAHITMWEYSYQNSIRRFCNEM
jgi:hypothetical protein